MAQDSLGDRARKFIKPYRIENGDRFKLKNFDPADTSGFGDEGKPEATELLRGSTELLAKYQDKLYADDRWSLLLIFQAMDAAGKDGAIKHVMSGVNPQGCQVTSFKAPSAEEIDHDFLWRCNRALPERGRIGIFNRSYYEEVLVVRVHPEILAKQRLPEGCVTGDIWKDRYKSIRQFENHLTRNGTIVRKFFLYVSKGEQKKRFLQRLDDPEKNWKFSAADVAERGFFDGYMQAYDDVIRETSTEEAPWFVVPADNKWFTRLVVGAAIVEALDSLKLQYPRVSNEALKQLATARASLMAEA
ncbi:MAG: polyphosphate kinase 2 family protein [Phycisphaerae bacterium]|nr:polyphosphate kinase 2 family protein [Phycisphaerae bacterium]